MMPGFHARFGRQISRNYLFPLEEANLLRSSGHTGEAAPFIAKFGKTAARGNTPTCIMRFPLGLASCCAARRLFRAASAYELVSQVSDADPETLQKANLPPANVRPAPEARPGDEEIPNRTRRNASTLRRTGRKHIKESLPRVS